MNHPLDIVADVCTTEECGVCIELNFIGKNGEVIGKEAVLECPICHGTTRPMTLEEFEAEYGEHERREPDVEVEEEDFCPRCHVHGEIEFIEGTGHAMVCPNCSYVIRKHYDDHY